MKNKALFLDFDGVLFDTLREVYLVNRFEYQAKSLFEPIDEEVYSRYSKYKFLVYNIWMFFYYNPLIFDCIEEEKIVERFFNAIKNRDIEKEKIFCENFLKTRHDLVLNHYDFWKNLEQPYHFFFEIKKLQEEKNPSIFVVSKKNKKAILERFSSHGLNFSENRVFAREILDKYSSKGEFLEEFMEKHGFEEAIFVDDNNNNLKTTENNPKIKNILALWGNTEPNSIGYSQTEAMSAIKEFFS